LASRLQRMIDALDRDDARILRVIEAQLSRYHYVPLEVIERRTGIPGSRLGRILLKLSSMKLVKRSLGSTAGYTLTRLGLDVLALWSLIKRGILVRVGEKIGVGKEGDVYLVEMPSGDLAVAKLHREGRTSFSKIKRVRSSVAFIDRKQWFKIAKLLGEREFKVLVKLHEKGAWVPEPIALDRHCVVQEYREGVELYRIKELPADEALTLLRGLLETLRIAYTEVGVIHGDLSEYNVLYEGDGRGVIIDWPQYVYRGEDGAEELLLRDIRYLTSYFRRRFSIDVSLEEALDYVRGVRSEPP